MEIMDRNELMIIAMEVADVLEYTQLRGFR